MGCFTSCKPFDIGADPDQDPDPGIFNGFYHCGIGAVARIWRDQLLRMQVFAVRLFLRL